MKKSKKLSQIELMNLAKRDNRPAPLPRPAVFKDRSKYDRNAEKKMFRKDKEAY